MSTSRLLHPLPAATASCSAVRARTAKSSAVQEFRAFVRRKVHGWGKGERATEALALIVTELVTNVCQHSGSPEVTVHLFAYKRTVGVRVSDNGRWRDPAGEHPDPRTRTCTVGVYGSSRRTPRPSVSGGAAWAAWARV